MLDHILLSPELARKPYVYDIIHSNAEFADQISAHDPASSDSVSAEHPA